MGNLCCCFQDHNEEDSNHSMTLMSKHGSTRERRAIPPSNQQAPYSISSVIINGRSPDQAGGPHNTVASRSRVKPEPAEHTTNRVDHAYTHGKNIFYPNNSHQLEKDFTSSSKVVSSGLKNETEHTFPSSDDEDVCPTCLEEYTYENPKILVKCSHHFHLGCIYEWMERSEYCPICSQVMLFDESS